MYLKVRLHSSAEGRVVQHKGGHALDLVGAFLVPRHGFAVLGQNVGNHLHGGGLAVAARDGDHIARQLYAAENVGTKPERHLSGLAAALAYQLTRKAQQLADKNGKKFFHRCSPFLRCFPVGHSYYKHKRRILQVFRRVPFCLLSGLPRGCQYIVFLPKTISLCGTTFGKCKD